MMEGVVQRGTGTLAVGQDLKDREIAGKTGTTQDFNDAWFSGFTPTMTTIVWVGFDNPTSLGEKETGGSIAAPIWHDYMAEALKSQPSLPFPMPQGLTLATWDSGSGGEAGGSNTIVADAFRPNQVPGASNDDLPAANATGLDQNGKPVATNPDGTPIDAGNPAANPPPPGAAPGAVPGTTPAAPAAPPANPNSIDKSLGNLY